MKRCSTCNRTYPDDTLAFCLVDGSVLSAPYEPGQTERIPPTRQTNPPPTEVLGARDSQKLQSTIYAPAPQVPPLHRRDVSDALESKRSIVPWLLVTVSILVVGIFGVWLLLSKLPSFTDSKRNAPAPSPTVVAKSSTMCGREVSAAIFDKWIEMGGQTGKLGCPINQQSDTPTSPQGSVGRWIQFEKGDGGYLIENTGSDAEKRLPLPVEGKAVEVTGCIFMLYSSLGGTKSSLGFPLGDGRETTTGARQDFEGGHILWDSKTSECRPYKSEGIGSGSGNGSDPVK
jgi:LGFP repeat